MEDTLACIWCDCAMSEKLRTFQNGGAVAHGRDEGDACGSFSTLYHKASMDTGIGHVCLDHKAINLGY